MYFVYIIKSIKFNKYYTGYTSDWEKRLKYHNRGSNKSTKLYRPYKLVHLEKFKTKKKAIQRENQIKKYKGGWAFKKLIGVDGK